MNGRKELRFTIDNRKVVATIVEFNGRWFVDRLFQVVKRPRAYCEVKRKLWPAMNPNKIARAALDQLSATSKGLIQDEAVLARIGGAA